MKNLLLIIGLGIGLNLAAQSNEIEVLNGNNVTASIGDEGTFFNAETNNYFINSIESNTIYSAILSVGGLDQNNNLQMTMTPNYQNQDSITAWNSGPICSDYQSIEYQNSYSKSNWKITKNEVNNFLANWNSPNYTIPSSIVNWPGNGNPNLGIASALAPFMDYNSNGIYEPNIGEHPHFPGEQAVYVILNNQENLSTPSEMKLEMHLMFYQFENGSYLDRTTFLNVKLFNRGATDFTNVKQSIYIDYDIGSPYEDYIGCDPDKNLSYAYNATLNDGTLGSNPPSQGTIILNQQMTSFMPYTSGTFFGNLYEQWNRMNSIWPDSTPLTIGGTGYGGTIPTNFAYPGTPQDNSSWSEVTANNTAGDRRVLQTLTIDEFPSGTMICTDYAFIYDRSGNHIENVQGLINVGQALQNLYDASDIFPCQTSSLDLKEITSIDFNLFPNPSNGETNVILPENISNGMLEVVSMDGKTVLSREFDSNTISFSIEKSGVYFVRIESEGIIGVKKLVVE